MMSNNYGKMLESLLKRPLNNQCADCSRKNPEYTSYNIGIFICKTCARIHCKLGVHISKVKHLQLDIFERTQIERLSKVGNQKAKAKWQEQVPKCYRIPTFNDNPILIEQWIRAKYVHGKFIRTSSGQCFNSGNLVGFLLKRGKKNTRYRSRKFILNEAEDSLTYYVDEDKDPKNVLTLSNLNISFAPSKMEYPNSFQLTHLISDSIFRHYYLYHEDPEIIVNWYMEIRCAKYHRLQADFPNVCESELLEWLPNDFLKEGWLWKTGPRVSDVFRKRWFTLDGRVLMYHDNPLDPYPKGLVFVGHSSDDCSVRSGVLLSIRDQRFSFTFQTSSRIYNLSAETESERAEWIAILNRIINKPLTLLDQKIASRIIKKRSRI